MNQIEYSSENNLYQRNWLHKHMMDAPYVATCGGQHQLQRYTQGNCTESYGAPTLGFQCPQYPAFHQPFHQYPTSWHIQTHRISQGDSYDNAPPITYEENQLHQGSTGADHFSFKATQRTPDPRVSPDSTTADVPTVPLNNAKVHHRRNKFCACVECSTNSVKMHKCDECEKTYKKVSHLKSHILKHRNQRPFVCILCGKDFTRSDELQRHKRIHTGERRYPCLKCEKRFQRSDHLSKHLKIHERKNE